MRADRERISILEARYELSALYGMYQTDTNKSNLNISLGMGNEQESTATYPYMLDPAQERTAKGKTYLPDVFLAIRISTLHSVHIWTTAEGS